MHPARQGSQTMSGFVDEETVIPVTEPSFCILVMSGMLWWQQRRCQSERVSGRVETQLADSEGGSVEPQRWAQLLGPIGAQKSALPSRMKSICAESIRISKRLCFVRYRHERRL